jgi:hypothetical protein
VPPWYEAQALVDKLLAWEDSMQGLSGHAVLVANDPDVAGDFDADIDDIRASFVLDRETTTIKLSETGAATRDAILADRSMMTGSEPVMVAGGSISAMHGSW